MASIRDVATIRYITVFRHYLLAVIFFILSASVTLEYWLRSTIFELDVMTAMPGMDTKGGVE